MNIQYSKDLYFFLYISSRSCPTTVTLYKVNSKSIIWLILVSFDLLSMIRRRLNGYCNGINLIGVKCWTTASSINAELTLNYIDYLLDTHINIGLRTAISSNKSFRTFCNRASPGEIVYYNTVSKTSVSVRLPYLSVLMWQ